MASTHAPYTHMRELKWSPAEKAIARKAFGLALNRELDTTIREAKDRAAKVGQPSDLWDLGRWLTQRRKDIDRLYDYRYSVLPLVFRNLIREGRITEQDLHGLAEDKLKLICRVAALSVVCLLSVLALGQQPSNETVPATMTKVVVHLQSPDVPEGSFAAQPKTMYRAGTRYCRIEELPDSEHGIHGLVVINEPDAWLINLMTKTAQYQVDPGPTFNCRLPVFADDVKSTTDAGSQIKGLEFGRELAYFQGRGATSRPGPILQGESTKAYTVEIGDSQLLLFTSGTPEKPVALARQHGNKRDAYWYGTYEEVPFDAKLFVKPDGIKVENAK